jgi:tRNA dimethylallyltransferase
VSSGHDRRPPLIVVVGPTASGKTELAVELAARRGAEIVSADSVQIYRHFEIGAGRPSPAELARVPHHLIGEIDPLDAVDAARFAELAAARIEAIHARAREVIVCGGTFLWVRALLFGLSGAPGADEDIRARHRERAEREGRAALHAELSRIDPVTAARLSPNDFVRVSRALEVHEQSGIPISQYQAEHGFRTPRYRARLVGVAREREELDQRIATRVRAMLDAGFIDEVRSLEARGYASARAMGTVGYKQIVEALHAPEFPPDEALFDSIRRATRVFARRQRTWLRDEAVEWLAPGTTELPELSLPEPSPSGG